MSVERTFVLDGERFDDLEGFYDEVSRELMGGLSPKYERSGGIPIDETYWGRNLDAFNDILSGDMGRVPGGSVRFTIVWRNSERSRMKLGPAETARWIRSTRPHAHPSNHPELDRRLAAAEAGRGTTLFDTLVEIIRDHPHIVLRLD
ncbi:MAG: barstar family protein [Gemmatimonadota bacterium]|nr:barstar family protein [Gemmatimonadota bacterium]